ncbi:type II toxin-antitoxin system PemK/MazF family toxin [Flavimarina sp. Hel_I_48]|uniref:type II toxin-antitoxin system PemK/MazF family toxin n=1 Tax=Flavimarina sp. Hel_I_48 TaxID=1392488 RepID=UPI0004DEF4F2|nr:type II toxin-antitoxin system PemK/MazF family toxin [Flavimarina sp. Hel_I_48]
MQIKQYEIWIANLNPNKGTEPGKTRPVLIIQTDLLNAVPHPSTLICPLTTQVRKETKLLRVHLNKGIAGLNEDCDIMIDQIRVIDNQRLVEKIGVLPTRYLVEVKRNILTVLDL